MPTVKKNMPSSRPLNGSMVTSICLRNSLSARISPATKAPSAIDSPATAAPTPVPTITNRVAATNSSGVSVAATSRKNGRSSSRPITTIRATASAACASAIMTPVAIEGPLSAPRMLTSSSIGTTARSCSSRTAKLARPVELIRRRCSDSSSMTIAVEDSARHRPMMTAAAPVLPSSAAMMLIATDEITTCRLPSPNTRRRMVSSRS